MRNDRHSFWAIAFRTIIVHTVTYFLVGFLAFSMLDYTKNFAQHGLAVYMRQTDDPWVMAGPLFQPLRGLIFASVFYPLQGILFRHKRGWLLLWWLLVAIGALSTFGPSPSSIEGMIYSRLSVEEHLLGLPELLAQTLLFSIVLSYWVRYPEKRWVNWVLGTLFVVVLLLPVLGLLTRS
ncbi:MAG TPA: hypothetical protein VFM05_11570 [Candidatus Saccharimonadales bacterium]|nr:hypothetical protein [Candidatus Saccharimonadales bacterium]